MTRGVFDKLVEDRIKSIISTLINKRAEYASDTDVLRNFHVGASITGKSVYEVCFGYMTKHLASIRDIVEKRSRGVFVDSSVIDEKIGDSICYLILLEGLLKEKS